MKKYITIKFLLIALMMPYNFLYAALNCSVVPAGSCTDTVLLRMSGSTNAHSELPSQSTSAYDGNVVCCSGAAGLGNSCSGNYKILARLSGMTNAHIEKNTESNPNYTQNACISSVYAGDEITVGYENTNCTGYDTTIASMEKIPTNSSVGNASAYANKICASLVPTSLTFNVSANAVYYGVLRTTNSCFAQPANPGAVACPTTAEAEAFNMSASTTAPTGYTITVQGATLTSGLNTITPLSSNTPSTVGVEQFGMRAVASGGTGAVAVPYAASGYAYTATASTPATVAMASSASSTTTYSVRYLANIASATEAGSYATSHTYVATSNF